VDEKKEGHRDYAAERKAKIVQLTEDLRSSETLMAEFVANPDETTKKYGLRLTEEEAAAFAAVAQGEELNEEVFVVVVGGTSNSNCNCGCGLN
jgi:hypothetical protein